MIHTRRFVSMFAGCLLLACCGVVGAESATDALQRTVAGVNVVVQRTGARDVIVLRGSLPAGDVFNPSGNPALATLVAGMLDKGTAGEGNEDYTRRLGELGASIAFAAESQMLTFSAKFLSEDLGTVMSILARQLRAPSFPEQELDKFKKQLSARLRRQFEDTDFIARNTFARSVFAPTHPNYDPSLEELLAGIEATDVDDLRAFHARHYGVAGMNLVAVGDVDPARLEREVRKNFGGWRSVSSPQLQTAPTTRPTTGAVKDVPMAGKTSVSVTWGFPTGMRWNDPGALALRVGTTILGSGLAGRLMARVRDKEGLTYQISAGSGNDVFADGEWRLSASFAPELLEKGLASARRELDLWIREGVTAAELADVKRKLITQNAVAMSSPDGLAGLLLDSVHRGRGPAYLREFPSAVEALTLEEVNAAIRKVALDELVLVRVGTLQVKEGM